MGEVEVVRSGHICPPVPRPVAFFAWPPFADPGSPVRIVDGDGDGDGDGDRYGRVRFAWRCCGTVIVQFLHDPESADTYSERLTLDELAPPEWGVSYCVPCIGSAWSLHLPCGHVAGEGCDCDTIALEARQGDTHCWCGARPEDSDEPCLHDVPDDMPHTCSPGIDYGCERPDCDGDTDG